MKPVSGLTLSLPSQLGPGKNSFPKRLRKDQRAEALRSSCWRATSTRRTGEGHLLLLLHFPGNSGFSPLQDGATSTQSLASSRGRRLDHAPWLDATRYVTTPPPPFRFFLTSGPRPTPRQGALTSSQHARVAWRCGLTSSSRSVLPLRCSTFARWPSLSSTVERALSVALRHVPGRLLSADTGARDPKGPAGRSRAGLHAPGDRQEGSGPGVFGQLSGALLAGRPS